MLIMEMLSQRMASDFYDPEGNVIEVHQEILKEK